MPGAGCSRAVPRLFIMRYPYICWPGMERKAEKRCGDGCEGVIGSDYTRMQAELFCESEEITVEAGEEWRQVTRFPRYDVSSFGRFRRRSTFEILRGTISHNGYVHIGLYRDGKQEWALAHRVVAETFLEKASENHAVVNHRDKDRRNNRVTNLEWATRSENSLHAWRTR